MSIRLFLLAYSSLLFISLHSAVISNACDSGRFGDNLFCYIKSKYLAHKYHIPFVLKPFAHADRLKLYGRETKRHSCTKKMLVKDEACFNTIKNDCLYMVSFHCKIGCWDKLYISTWREIYENRGFRESLKELISLENEINMIKPPANMISVAVHVRRPSGHDFDHGNSSGAMVFQQLYDINLLSNRCNFDECRKSLKSRYIDACFYFKIVPDQYYIDQIKAVSKIFEGKQLYVYIFTDYKDPRYLMELYKREVNNPNIIFDTRESTSFVAEDMLSITNFDCLIRSDSNFSQMAEFLGEYKVVISPKEFAWYKDDQDRNYLVVTEVLTR